MNALGMIEVYGYLPAVEALDSALKAASVNLVEVTKVTGGLVSVLVSGDVGAVKAAVDAASAAASRVGSVVSVHVIARPAEDVARMLGGSKKDAPQAQPESADEEPPVESGAAGGNPKAVPDRLTGMSVSQLRTLARELEIPGLSKHDIRYAKKGQLVEVISRHNNQES